MNARRKSYFIASIVATDDRMFDVCFFVLRFVYKIRMNTFRQKLLSHVCLAKLNIVIFYLQFICFAFAKVLFGTSEWCDADIDVKLFQTSNDNPFVDMVSGTKCCNESNHFCLFFRGD